MIPSTSIFQFNYIALITTDIPLRKALTDSTSNHRLIFILILLILQLGGQPDSD